MEYDEIDRHKICCTEARFAMRLKVQNEVKSHNPSPEDIETALRSLDGYRRQQITLVDSNRGSLTLFRRRSPEFHVCIETERQGLSVRRDGKRLLDLDQAIDAAQAWADGRSEWPLLMRWSESIEKTEEALRQDLKETERNWRDRPWQMVGWTVLVFLGVFAVQLLLFVPADYYADRGFASVLMHEPSLGETLIANVVILTVANILFGLWLWHQDLLERERLRE